jgi:hypothetical protein
MTYHFLGPDGELGDFGTPTMDLDNFCRLGIPEYLIWRSIVLRIFDDPGGAWTRGDFEGTSETWKLFRRSNSKVLS